VLDALLRLEEIWLGVRTVLGLVDECSEVEEGLVVMVVKCVDMSGAVELDDLAEDELREELIVMVMKWVDIGGAAEVDV